MDSDTLYRILQQSVAPVVMISGVGLLLLTMTNRLGRIVDRSRILARDIQSGIGDKQQARLQVRILYRRGRLMRSAIFFTSITIFGTGLLMLALLVHELLHVNIQGAVLAVLALLILSLLAGMVQFMRDISLTLHALKLELQDVLDDPTAPRN